MKDPLVNNLTPFLSLSEARIKFLCSVADEYEFISPAPAIYYDPVTYLPTFLIDRLDQEYRADFLIRHRANGEAYLVELHPASMVNDARLWLRRRMAESYIKWKGLDWQYLCLFQEYVVLTESETVLFNSYCEMKTESDRCKWLEDYMSFSHLLKDPSFKSDNYSLLDFLIHGLLPETV